jgi:amino-acid N-acetyltransferase
MKIRRAKAAETAAIHCIVAEYAAQGVLLPRTMEQIERGIGDYLVALDGDRVIGCVALEIYGGMLAEVRSLAVAPEARGAGTGAKLLDAAMKQARRRKIARLLAVTRSTTFFERHGFRRVRGGMPVEKVARDCSQCSKAPTCRLEALGVDLAPSLAVLPVLQPAHLPRAAQALPA